MTFLTGGAELIDAIEPMWRQLTMNAAGHSEHFSRHFAERRFEERRAELKKKAEMGKLRVDIARDTKTNEDLGYCVCSVDGVGGGEVESLFVSESTRGRGIGDSLIRRAVEWMESCGTRTMVVFTVYGNDRVLPFYERYGFKPKMVMLERREGIG